MSPLLRQSWMISALMLNAFAQGLTLAYPVSLLAALSATDSPIYLDLSSATWLASLTGPAMLTGKILSSTLLDVYGRRLAQALTMLPGITAWLLFYFAKDVTTLMVARFLGGMSKGAATLTGGIITAEFGSPKYRGLLILIKVPMWHAGISVMHACAQVFHWRTVALLSMIPSVTALCIVCTWPESPFWLAAKGRYADSEKSFYYLRGNDKEAVEELKKLIKSQRERSSKRTRRQTPWMKLLEFFKKFREREFVKPLFIVVISYVLMESALRQVFASFAHLFMKEIFGDSLMAKTFILWANVAGFLGLILSCVLVRLFKRRTILFSTGIVSLVLLVSVSLCQHLMTSLMATDYQWVKSILLLLYFMVSNLAIVPFSVIASGELFPLRHKESGNAMSGILIGIVATVSLKSTPYMLKSLSISGTFGVFALIMGLCLLCLYSTLPETKDRTLQEIEEFFSHGAFNEMGSDDKDDVAMLESLPTINTNRS